VKSAKKKTWYVLNTVVINYLFAAVTDVYKCLTFQKKKKNDQKNDPKNRKPNRKEINWEKPENVFV
jgi:hypothetical protein